MSKRIFSLILAAVMVFSLLPVFASAEGADFRTVAAAKTTPMTPGEMTTDSMVTNKWLTDNNNGSYDLTMSAYATGGTMTQELQSDVPLDIVLVIDQSGSMLTPDMSSASGYEATTKNWTVDQAVGWYYKVGNQYYELKAEKGSVYNASVRPYLTDDLLGTSGGEDWHTNWETHYPNYFVKDASGNLCQLYSCSYGYVGGYDCQFYYYPQGSSSAVMIPFNSASGSTTASYSRDTFSLGTGSMNSNSNRLWTTVYRRSSTNANTRLYYLDDNGQKVYVGNEITSSSDIALANVTMYTQTTANMTRLDALKAAAGQFVQAIGDRAAETGANHRVAVVGFAGNEVPNTSIYEYPAGTNNNITSDHILGQSKYVTQNTGLFIGKEFKNYITPDLSVEGLGPTISNDTLLYDNITYFYKYKTSNNYYALNLVSYKNSDYPNRTYERWWDTYSSSNGYLGRSDVSYYYRYRNNNSTTWNYSYSQVDDYVVEMYNDNTSTPKNSGRNGTYKVYYPAVTELEPNDYQAALVNIKENDVSGRTGQAAGANHVNDNIDWAVQNINAYGGTYLSYGMAMANNVFKYNSNVVPGDEQEHKRIVVVFTDGEPGRSGFDQKIADEAKAAASTAKDTYGAAVYTVGLYPGGTTEQVADFMHELSSEYFTTKTEVTGQSINTSNSTYYFDDENGLPHAVNRDKNSQWTRPGWSNAKVGNRWIPVTNNNGPRKAAVWVDSNNWLRGAKWNASDTRTGPNDNIWQFYSVGDSIEQNQGQYYYTAQNSAQLREVFQSISESIQTPYTTVSLNGENSVLRDVVTSHFTVNTDKTVNPVTFSLEKGTVASQGANPVFDPVTDPTSAESAILEGITYSWVTNDDGSKTLDVKGFDYSTNYVAYQHPGYKLIATVHGLKTDDLGKLYSNESTSGVYKDDSMVAPLPMPYITREVTDTATYVIDFNAPMKLAENAKFQVPVAEIRGKNGVFSKTGEASGTGTVTYKLNAPAIRAENNATVDLNTQYSGVDKALIHGKFVSGTRVIDSTTDVMSYPVENTAAWKEVTVVPATSVYFDDELAAGSALTVGQGYTASLNSSGDVSGAQRMDIPAGENQEASGKTVSFKFTGTRIDVYAKTNAATTYVMATLKDENGNKIADQKAQLVFNGSRTERFNVPTVSITCSEPGTYTLELYALKNANYQLDGIRVYNELQDETVTNLDGTTTTDTSAQDAYKKLDEQNATYTALRGLVLAKEAVPVDGAGEPRDGIGFFTEIAEQKEDGSWSVIGATVDDYQADGPKSEVYLQPGQGLSFTISNWDELTAGDKTPKLMVGLSAPEANNGVVSLSNGDAKQTIAINSPVDMYYPIAPKVSADGKTADVMILNPSSGSGMVSVTNLKVSGTASPVTVAFRAATPAAVAEEPTVEEQFMYVEVNAKTVQYASSFAELPETDAQAETPVEEPSPEPTGTPSISDVVRQIISSFIRALFNSIARLFGH